MQLWYLVFTEREVTTSIILRSKENHWHSSRARSRTKASLAPEQISSTKERPQHHGGIPILAYIHLPIRPWARRHKCRRGVVGLETASTVWCVHWCTDLPVCFHTVCVYALKMHTSCIKLFFFMKQNLIVLPRKASLSDIGVCAYETTVEICCASSTVYSKVFLAWHAKGFKI